MKKIITILSFCLIAMALPALADDGKPIYDQHCVVCHSINIGPAPGNKELWQPRLDAKGMDGLLESAKKGINAMPAMGACTSCTDEQLRAAIIYMTTFE